MGLISSSYILAILRGWDEARCGSDVIRDPGKVGLLDC